MGDKKMQYVQVNAVTIIMAGILGSRFIVLHNTF